ncbi:AAA domain-containing protein [Halosimplex carlsbadense]|uniref:AAA domain-containing protein n=1 Tax=Halosimplex carlsbadense TaxID=171164 RepID=UPI0009E1CBAD|nr:AAA domain-containing protein [Halosimplex carlsbadense]
MSSYDPDDSTPPRQDEEWDNIRLPESEGQQRVITPARIGEYIGFEQCPRYFKHSVQEIESSRYHDGDDFQESFQPLNILLTKAGEEFEERVCDEILSSEDALVDLARDAENFAPDDDAIIEVLRTACEEPAAPDEPTVLYQASFVDNIGDWHVAGDADLILVWSTPDGAKARVLDVKSAQEEKSYHQIQAATYVDLLRRLIDESQRLNEDAITCEGGIITRADSYTPPSPENVPRFDVEPRIIDVRRLLAPDGELDKLADKPFEDVPYQLNDKCANCAYNESCLTDAYEDGHLRLLGLSPAQQATLEEHGIETVDDLADIARPPDPEDWYPTEYRSPTFEREEYRELKATPGIGEEFPTLLYRAKAMADYLDPDGGEIIGRFVPWIPSTGRCPLPEDEPPEDTNIAHDWLHGSMVRVYLNIQVDHLRDRLLQLSARVSATASEAEAQRISVVSQGAPDGASQSQAAEKELLETFITRLYDAIRAISEGIEFSGIDQSDPPLHFYLYTGMERTALEDAFDRHTTPVINSFQSMLEGSPGHDSPMVSRLRPSVDTHTAIPAPSPGLLPAYDHLSPVSDDVFRKSRDSEEWSYTPDSTDEAESIHLRSVFSYRLFDYSVTGEKRSDPGVKIDPTERDFIHGIPTRVRYGAEIPLGYLWSAVGRIDDEWVEEVKSKYDIAGRELARYRYHDIRTKDREIDSEDIRALGRHFCDALEHVERSLNSRDAVLNKDPYPMGRLAVDAYSPPSLAAACHRYLWIEHTAQRKEEYDHYRKLPTQRMLSGKSIPVSINKVEEKNSRTLHVEGVVRFDLPFLRNEEEIRRACRQKGSEGSSSGSWMVANPYDFGRLDTETTQPYEIESGVQVTLETLDLDSRAISFDAHNFYGEGDDFGRTHDKWTTEEKYDTSDSNQTYFANGEQVILDPQTDDITAGRAKAALDHADTNELHEVLEAVRFGNELSPKASGISDNGLDTFADWLSESFGPDSLPSDEQRAFITEGTAQIVGLQGPPGTGKTAGAFAPGLCARMYAAAANDAHFAGLVTAPSNTAIDELLEDVAETMADAEQATGKDTSQLKASLENAHLVRIANDEPENAPENVTYIDYNDSDDAEKLEQLREWVTSGGSASSETGSGGQSRLSNFGAVANDDSDADESVQTLVFATPGRAWRLVSKLCPDSEDEETADQEYWDVLAADEASMLTLPNFLLAGSALAPGGQVLVGGDHRQLPPVQKHDWDDESRRDIRATVPYLSALDYLRLLRGEDDVLDEERQSEWEHEHRASTETTGIPFFRLSRTYRFGSTTADLARQTVYKADGIDYESGRESAPVEVSDVDLPRPVDAILGDASVTLVTYHSDEHFQQWNPIEAALATRILEGRNHTTSAGVVTPHNAQRSRVTALLEDAKPTNEDKSEIAVETVNRFQGGEQDLMIVSATVSDPQYISKESDFLLSQNRVNVSLTRHRDKLVIIAPETLLGYIPADPDLYDETLIWKEIGIGSGEAPTNRGQNPIWDGTLSEILSTELPSSIDEDPQICVYTYENAQ